MKRLFFTVLIFFTFNVVIFGQNTFLMGKVQDIFTFEPLPGVYVIVNENVGTYTDSLGIYKIKVIDGINNIEFRYLGYKSEKISLPIKPNENKTLNMKLTPISEMLEEIVVTASKFEQKKSEVSVSMEVIKPINIENSNSYSIENTLQKVPGVVILEKQVSIRGGSGYTYGAGSRVLMLLDDLPLMTGASGEAIWDIIPVENIYQVEIIKGASSALFGSSALNGVINIRTGAPTTKPVTKVSFSTGIYGNPSQEYKTWEISKIKEFNNFQFFHSVKIKDIDFTFSGHFSNDIGYRENDNYRKARIYSKIQYNSQQIQGLKIGINFLTMQKEGQNFLLWKDGDSGVYKASPDFKQNYNLSRVVFDPYLTLSRQDQYHYLKFRFYKILNNNSTAQSNFDKMLYFDYRFNKNFLSKLNLSTGFTLSKFSANSEFYGNQIHNGYNAAFYVQVDKKINRFSLSLGVRWEYYMLDSLNYYSKPIVRIGTNYKIFEYTNARISFGQGFRYPTIAEKFTQTSVGSLNIFPNISLSPESGWSLETGIYQGFKIAQLKGFFDLAAFWTQYLNMTEFAFGIYNPPNISLNWNPGSPGYIFNWVGFSAQNTQKALITGIESVIGCEGKIYGITIFNNLGYTYLYPITLNHDSAYLSTFSDYPLKTLKYRNNHQFKWDVELSISNFSFGTTFLISSPIINIDKAFESLSIKINNIPIVLGDLILPGLEEYRNHNNKTIFLLDSRISYYFLKKHKLMFIVKNVFNKEYMLRPGDVQPPISFSLQYVLKF